MYQKYTALCHLYIKFIPKYYFNKYSLWHFFSFTYNVINSRSGESWRLAFATFIRLHSCFYDNLPQHLSGKKSNKKWCTDFIAVYLCECIFWHDNVWHLYIPRLVWGGVVHRHKVKGERSMLAFWIKDWHKVTVVWIGSAGRQLDLKLLMWVSGLQACYL